jgi:hypothetical protein
MTDTIITPERLPPDYASLLPSSRHAADYDITIFAFPPLATLFLFAIIVFAQRRARHARRHDFRHQYIVVDITTATRDAAAACACCRRVSSFDAALPLFALPFFRSAALSRRATPLSPMRRSRFFRRSFAAAPC